MRFMSFVVGVLLTSVVFAEDLLKVSVFDVQGQHALGEVVFQDTDYGLLVMPNLQGLPQGIHGFHVHEHPNCGHMAMDAGSHFDPQQTEHHLGPYGKGHLGDLPALSVDHTGHASQSILAPRLKVKDLKGHALVIHSGGDNYQDIPKLGGGGARIACGVIISMLPSIHR